MKNIILNKTRILRAALFALPVIVLCAAIILPAAKSVSAAKGDLENVSYHDARISAPLRLTLGKADLIDMDGRVADVLVANPNVIDVMAVQSGRLYVVGLSVGDTNIIALDEKGNVIKRMDIHVTYDLQAIQSFVDDLFPDETVKISSVHDQILLTGSVSNPEKANKISNVVAQYVGDLQDTDGSVDELISNLLDVRGEQQVMLQVRIVEASRNIARDLGLQTQLTGNGGGGTVLSLSSSTDIALAETAGTFGLSKAVGASWFNGVDLTLNALEDEGAVNVLAEPNLTAVSGESAGFLAGGEYPVPSGVDQRGNLVVEFKEFGVSLNFKPVVLSGERISLQLDTEVSSLDETNSVNLGTATVPALEVRRTNTTVEVPSGGSLMIAGILQAKTLEGMSGLPGVKKMPVIGDLLSSRNFSRDETELVVIVTTYLVEPYKDEQQVAQLEPVGQMTPLAEMFSKNIRRKYNVDGNEEFNDAISGSVSFGYIIN